MTGVRTFWFGSPVRRSRMVIAVLAVLSLAGGGLLAHVSAGGAGGSNVIAAGGVSRIGDGSVLVAAQPAPSTLSGPGAPSASGTATPSATSRVDEAEADRDVTEAEAQAVADQDDAAIERLGRRPVARADQRPAGAARTCRRTRCSAGLNRSAHKHNLVMMGSCGMSHQCPGEASLGDRISAEGVHWTSCGENIGWSGPHPNTTSAIVSAAEGLTTSMYNEKPPDDGHRLNLLSSSFHHIGIDAIRDSSGKVWLTQDFSS